MKLKTVSSLLVIVSSAQAYLPILRTGLPTLMRKLVTMPQAATSPARSNALHQAVARSGASPLSGSTDDGDKQSNEHIVKAHAGDPLRASTGIRPSLHPTTINAISEALLIRSSPSLSASTPIDVAGEVEPLEVAMAAGTLAAGAIEKRHKSCEGDDENVFTTEEGQTLAGRVVGVVMRLRELEQTLAFKVNSAAWVTKYREHGTFGVLSGECDAIGNGEGNEDLESVLAQRLKDDPLFRMCRAECLLALFIHTVEVPQLEKLGQQLADGSKIDFIDSDRMDVLLSDAS